jgi:uncharacterized membrane protein YdcZ (DUF606 family)
MLRNTHRKALWRPYPGVFGRYLIALIGFGAYLLGARLPWHAPTAVQLLMELLVGLFVWKAWQAALASRRKPIKLYRAQDMFTFAVLTQTVILLLPGGP